MQIIDQVERIMAAHKPLCRACSGTGKVDPSPLLALVGAMATGRNLGKVRCLECFGSGIQDDWKGERNGDSASRTR